jgi:hypothetical protein
VSIHGTENMSSDQINFELQRGGRFVRYLYTVSVILLSYKKSEVYLIKAGESSMSKGLGFALVSLIFGWSGIPWGPIYTIQSLACDIGGGEDITSQVWNVAKGARAGT